MNRYTTGSYPIVRKGQSPSRKASPGRRENSFSLSLLLWPLLFTLSASAVYMGYHALSKEDVLPIRSVAVTGTTPEHADEVAVYAALRKGTPLFGVDPDVTAERVEEHPMVKSALVRRVPPDSVTIDVTMRETLFTAVIEGTPYLVDQEGTPFGKAHTLGSEDHIIVNGAEVAELKNAAAAVRLLMVEEMGDAVSEVHFANKRMSVQLKSGPRAEFGKDNWMSKVRLLKRAERAAEDKGLVVANYYLDDDRRPERVALRLRTPTEMQVKKN